MEEKKTITTERKSTRRGSERAREGLYIFATRASFEYSACGLCARDIIGIKVLLLHTQSAREAAERDLGARLWKFSEPY